MLEWAKNNDIKELISTIPSLSTAFIDLIPGSLLVLVSPLFVKHPFLLLIYPQLLSFRGSISGIIVGRYATSLHLGIVKPSLRNNTPTYYTIVFTSFILVIVGSLFVCILTMAWLYLIYGVALISFSFLFSFIISIVFLSTILSLPINLLIGNSSFSRGYDPDIIAYPVASTIGDITITASFILFTIIAFLPDLKILLYLGILFSFLTPILLYNKVNMSLFRREFSESILSIIIVSFIVGVTGNLFRGIESYLHDNTLIYVIYPSFLTLSGDSASIIGSKTSTKLALGEINDYIRSFYFRELSIILLGGSIILIGLIIYSAIVTSMFGLITLGILLAGVISISLLSLLSIFTAYLTYYKGLDPDHFINPISSVTADMVATLILSIMMIIL
jgi:mgtE-like transporter